MSEIKLAKEKLGAMIRIPTVSKHEYEDLSQFYLFHQELEKLFPLIHEKLEKTVLPPFRVCTPWLRKIKAHPFSARRGTAPLVCGVIPSRPRYIRHSNTRHVTIACT